MSTRPKLFVLCGLPFAGKSTLARMLEERFGLVRIEIDASLVPGSNGEFGERQWRIAVQRSFRALHLALNRGDSVVWDSASLTRLQRGRIRATGERYGAEIALIHVATPETERRRRKTANLDSRNRLDVPDKDFEEAQRAFEPPTDDERALIFDGIEPMDEWNDREIAPLFAAQERDN